MSGVTYATRKPVDYVVVGSGAAGGVLAKELATAGMQVVVLEAGPRRGPADFRHDELSTVFQNDMLASREAGQPQTFRLKPDHKAQLSNQPPPAFYAQTLGGSSVHFTGNYWRFRPVDFNERSQLGEISGTGFADWPISYEELEPYYTKVDWQVGVSGTPGPFDPPRGRPYPMPPMPVKSSGVLFERGAKKLGLHPQPAPMAILSRSFNGRPGCIHCGFCMAFGCEVNAKSSTLATMLPLAEATGHCEIRTECKVFRLETDDRGQVSEVIYFDADGKQQAQKARRVILAANGAETPRILLQSESSLHPDGLANGSGLVGKYLMFNSHSSAHAVFEHPLNEYKSIQVTRILHDFYDSDPERGFYGGGGLDARGFLDVYPILNALNTNISGEGPLFGKAFKQRITSEFNHKMAVLCNGTSLARPENSITLDPELKDDWGRPALRVTYEDHPDDLKLQQFLQDRAMEILDAAGAQRTWRTPVAPQNVGAHLLGTCRMGNDPESSVVNRFHRAHEVDNLYICDGSSFVTSGRGQPTMTIQALAFRAADHLIKDTGRRAGS